MTQSRIFAVGDVHGTATGLERLLETLPLKSGDWLVFLGDYLNRGPSARKVLDLLLDLQQRHQRTVFLMGNHEHALLQYAEYPLSSSLQLLREMGLQATLDSYGHDPASGLKRLAFLPPEHLRFLRNLQPCLRMDGYLFFHAPIPANADPETAAGEALASLLARRNLDGLGWENSPTTLVFGHVPLETPLLTPNLIGIDTGAAYGDLLTAVELPARRFYHAPCGE